MPTLAAISYKNNLGHPYMYPNNKLGYVENFLHMMFGLPPRSTRWTRWWPTL
jgi:citrate synthase